MGSIAERAPLRCQNHSGSPAPLLNPETVDLGGQEKGPRHVRIAPLLRHSNPGLRAYSCQIARRTGTRLGCVVRDNQSEGGHLGSTSAGNPTKAASSPQTPSPSQLRSAKGHTGASPLSDNIPASCQGRREHDSFATATVTGLNSTWGPHTRSCAAATSILGLRARN